MQFLIDAQLPPALADFLVAEGHEAEHVGEVGLLTADDSEIWAYAMETGAVIVTKDEDFAERASLVKKAPRVGVASHRQQLEASVAAVVPQPAPGDRLRTGCWREAGRNRLNPRNATAKIERIGI